MQWQLLPKTAFLLTLFLPLKKQCGGKEWELTLHLKELTGKIFSQSNVADSLSDEMSFLTYSINLQGNDKLLWMLLQYFDKQKKQGDKSPEETILDNANLLNIFLRHIV